MDWHRLFGLFLADFFTGTGYEVEIEKDLSAKKQLLDVVVIRKGEAVLDRPLPDGLEELAEHNLITFKSHRQALDAWAIKELIGHYVNYRKQAGPSVGEMPAEEQFRLFAVAARRPELLASVVELDRIAAGVYDCLWGTDRVRVIVAGELSLEDRNGLLHLFSASADRIEYGRRSYQPYSSESSTLLRGLIDRYTREGLTMPYTMEDFKREFRQKFLDELTPEERLKGLPPEERLKGLPPEERLKGLPPEERLKGLPPEERLKGLPPEERLKGLPPEERLKGLTPDQLRAYLAKLEAERSDDDK